MPTKIAINEMRNSPIGGRKSDSFVISSVCHKMLAYKMDRNTRFTVCAFARLGLKRNPVLAW
jgi:hypothetical protein